MESYFSSKEYNHLLEKYRKIFKINGGAMESGVSSIVDVISGDGEEKGVEEGGVEKECRLVIDLEVSRFFLFFFSYRLRCWDWSLASSR